jgi:mannitol 2-dehydrogenase
MVDRIVPATTAEHRAVVADRYGVMDAWPVATESFRQWVIEDEFPLGRPAWDLVGAQMTTDLEPYERMKMRLLNGSHQALGYLGLLLGYEFADQAIGDAAIRKLVRMMMDEEVTPLLSCPAGIDLAAYKRTLLQRFANRTLRDQLARIVTDGSARMPKFVLPSIAEQVSRGGPVDALCFTVAAWFHFLAGKGDRGRQLPVVDAQRDRLMAAASDPAPGCEKLFALTDLLDASLLQSPRFRNQVRGILQSLREQGTRLTLDRFLETRGLR